MRSVGNRLFFVMSRKKHLVLTSLVFRCFALFYFVNQLVCEKRVSRHHVHVLALQLLFGFCKSRN